MPLSISAICCLVKISCPQGLRCSCKISTCKLINCFKIIFCKVIIWFNRHRLVHWLNGVIWRRPFLLQNFLSSSGWTLWIFSKNCKTSFGGGRRFLSWNPVTHIRSLLLTLDKATYKTYKWPGANFSQNALQQHQGFVLETATLASVEVGFLYQRL